MYKTRPWLILILCILATISIAVFKFTNPTLHYFNNLLILVILFTILLPSDIYAYIFCFLTVLTIATSVLRVIDTISNQVIIQQLLTCGVAIVTMLLVLHIKNLYRSIESERMQMNALFEFANEGIILTNSKQEILLINPKARKLFLYEVDEIIGQQINVLIPENTGLNSNYLSEYYQNPSALNQEQPMLYAVKKNGRKFPVEINLSHYSQRKETNRYNSGRENFVLIFLTDISERKDSENKMLIQQSQLEKITSDVRKMNVELENKVAERTLILQEALRELEKSQMELNKALSDEKELNEIKSRFVSMASHEFRTPLSTILSSAALVTKYPNTEESSKREKHIQRIKDSVKHLTDLLEDFLNLGKLEEGKVSRKVAVFDIREFLQDLIDELEMSLKQGQHIALTITGESVFATDKRLLKNVLINLLNNAIKFSDINKPIDLRVDNAGNRIQVEVKDKGIGISTEDMPHLFSTFYRGTNAVNIHGTGLGLHIVKRYVDMLEGDIRLTSNLSEGTTCNLAFPSLDAEN